MKYLLARILVTTGSALSFTALGLNPAQALLWDFTFDNEEGQVGQVTLDDINLTYSSLNFNGFSSIPVAGNYDINGELNSGTFLVNFDSGYSLNVPKLYSYWGLYNESDANGQLLIGSPRTSNVYGYGFSRCSSVTDNSYDCVKYTTRNPVSEPLSVPEPLTIFGTVTALGVGSLLKQESSKKRTKASQIKAER